MKNIQLLEKYKQNFDVSRFLEKALSRELCGVDQENNMCF